VFSAGDSAILGALQLLKSRGQRVPQDVALAGFSNEALTLVPSPCSPSVDQRTEEMGQAAFRLFTELLAAEGTAFSPRQVVLPPQLSCGLLAAPARRRCLTRRPSAERVAK
jgi:LacI family transcriptional regulator